jgi:hypothetical protein
MNNYDPCSILTIGLYAMVERWREKADTAEHYDHCEAARELRFCADELAAQL